jgi:hypothetical protein
MLLRFTRGKIRKMDGGIPYVLVCSLKNTSFSPDRPSHAKGKRGRGQAAKISNRSQSPPSRGSRRFSLLGCCCGVVPASRGRAPPPPPTASSPHRPQVQPDRNADACAPSSCVPPPAGPPPRDGRRRAARAPDLAGAPAPRYLARRRAPHLPPPRAGGVLPPPLATARRRLIASPGGRRRPRRQLLAPPRRPWPRPHGSRRRHRR